MASHHPHEAETLLPPGATVDPARSSVADSLGVPNSSYYGVRESQYSSVPLSQSYDPYAEAAVTPSPRATTPTQYNDSRSVVLEKSRGDKPLGKPSLFKILILLAVLILVAVAVVVPVYFAVIRPNNNNNAVQSNSGSGSATSSSTAPGATQSSTPQAAITGGDGSLVTTEAGSFIYNNSFGGFWYYDSADPFKNHAQAQSWSPPLNTSWRWGVDQIRGCVITKMSLCIILIISQ